MRSLVVAWLLGVSLSVLAGPGLAAPTGERGAEPVPEQTIPYKQQPTVGFGSLQRVAVVLVLAIGVCLVAAMLLRKELGKRGLLALASSERIAVVASRRLAPRLTVFLINVDERAYVLVQSGNDMQLTAHGAAAQVESES